MIIIGIDPGSVSGGIAFNNGISSWAYAMPETERDIYDLLLEHKTGAKAFIEAVHSMPGQGVSSSFKFGQNYGMLRAFLIALQIPFETVTPQKWQKTLGCLTKGDKNVSKRKAQELFPDLKITHKIADALLIAYYGAKHGL
jgi:crossover junction endodeoxyribonuclease RuvC